MSMKERQGWVRGMLTGIPNSAPPPPQVPDNVVHLPQPDINERLLRIRVLDQELMSIAIDMDRLALKFNTVRAELLREREFVLEKLRIENIKNAEFAHHPPEVELLEQGP
tara:strand:+ start:786 stop:1115 length:330 start_codon:yes stop_codon:yes gene_type:complete